MQAQALPSSQRATQRTPLFKVTLHGVQLSFSIVHKQLRLWTR